jgi:single-strand DNA-binding protein
MINKVILIGRVGADPEIKATKSSQVGKMRIATSTSRKVDDKWVEESEWHSIVCFGNLAAKLDKIHKGDLIYVAGRIHYGSYENKEGVKINTTDILADEIRTLQQKQFPAEGREQYQKKDNWSKAETTWPQEDEGLEDEDYSAWK